MKQLKSKARVQSVSASLPYQPHPGSVLGSADQEIKLGCIQPLEGDAAAILSLAASIGEALVIGKKWFPAGMPHKKALLVNDMHPCFAANLQNFIGSEGGILSCQISYRGVQSAWQVSRRLLTEANAAYVV